MLKDFTPPAFDKFKLKLNNHCQMDIKNAEITND
jgi:hypothetical protein